MEEGVKEESITMEEEEEEKSITAPEAGTVDTMMET